MFITTKIMKNMKVTSKVRALVIIPIIALGIFAALMSFVVGNPQKFIGDSADGYIRSVTVFTFLITFLSEASIIALGVFHSCIIKTDYNSHKDCWRWRCGCSVEEEFK